MENDDDLGFFPSFQLENKHSKLDQHSGKKQEVVAGDKSCATFNSTFWPEPACENNQAQHCAAKQAGPCLFQSENQKFNQCIADAVTR